MKRLLPILSILLLASLVRIINSSSWPPWTDEGWSIFAVSDHQLDVILNREIIQDRHPPLYFIALSAWETVAGDSRLVLRFLSIIGGILLIALTYRIGKDWFGERTGLYAALLLSVLHIAVYYSQEIRDYGFLALAVTLMTLLFLRYLRHPSRKLLVAYVLSVVLMLYTLYFGILFLIIQGVVGLFIWRASLRNKVILACGYITALILYVPWIIVVLRQINRLSEGIVDALPATPAGTWQAITLILSNAAIPLICLYVIGIWHVLKQAANRTARLTIVLSGIGIFIILVAANAKFGTFVPRILSFFVPMLMIICGYGLSLIGMRVALLLASGLTGYFLITHPVIRPRLDSVQVAETVAADYAPSDLIVFETGWDDYALAYEMTLKLGHSVDPDIIRTAPWEINFLQTLAVPQIEDDLRTHRRVWLVNWLYYPQVIQYLEDGGSGYRRVLTNLVPIGKEYQGMFPDLNVRVNLYEKPPVDQCDCTRYRFGDTLWLRDTVVNDTVQRGHTAQVDLWWSALKVPPQDYTVVAFMLNARYALIARDDHIPTEHTTNWQLGQLYFDRHRLTVPAELPLGIYELAIKVYVTDRNWLPVNGSEYVVIGTIRVVD